LSTSPRDELAPALDDAIEIDQQVEREDRDDEQREHDEHRAQRAEHRLAHPPEDVARVVAHLLAVTEPDLLRVVR
jgi:hypothetical protein